MLQGINVLSPLIVIMIISRRLDSTDFSVLLYSISIIQYLFMITDYGFFITATDKVSKNKDNDLSIAKIVDRVYSAKVIIYSFLIAVCFTVYKFTQINVDKNIFYLIILISVTQCFQPTWLFHGIQKVETYFLIMGIPKLLYALCVYFYVNEHNGAFLTLTLLFVTNFCIMVVSNYWIYLNKKINFKFSFNNGFDEIKKALPFFISRLCVASYTSMSTIIIGSSNLILVPLYASSEYIYKAGQSLLSPIIQASLPHASITKDSRGLVKLISIFSIPTSVMSIILLFLGEDLFYLIYGNVEYLDINVFYIFCILIIINFLGAMMGYPLMSALDAIEKANLPVYVAGLFAVAMFVALVISDSVTPFNVALVVLMSESIVLILRAIVIRYLVN